MRPTRRLALLALLAAALPWGAARAAAAPGEVRSSRPRVSANGRYTVRLLELGPGRCRLEVAGPSGLAWSLERCVGGVDDLYFPSQDGARVWVLVPLPVKGTRAAGGGGKRAPPAWANTPVASLWGREGRLAERRLFHFVASARELSEVRHLSKHLMWLEGTLGIPGTGPRLTEAGRVEFESVGGKTHQLRFQGSR